MSYMDQIVEQARAMGGPVADLLRPSLEYRERAGALDQALTALRAADERERAEVVRDLSEGRLDPRDVPARVADAWSFDSPASKTLVAAAAAAHGLSETAAVRSGPKLFEALQGICGAVVGEAAKLTATLPGNIVDNESAFRAGPDNFAAWMRCDKLVEQWLAAHRLARTLRLAGWVAGPEHNHKSAHRPDLFTMFADPDRLPVGWGKLPAPLQLGAAQAAGAQPGLYDWETAKARLVAHDRRHGRRDVHAVQEQVVTFRTREEFAMALPVIEATAQANVPTGPPAGW